MDQGGPAPVERFKPTGGQTLGYLTLAAVAALLVYLLVADRTVSGLRIGTGGIAFAVVIWLTQLRPRITAHVDSLLLVNSVRDQVVPLTAIDRVEVTRALSIWVSERRYVCTGIGASPRKRRAGTVPGHGPATYADYVGGRIEELVREARARSAPGTPTGEVQPRWAWLPLAALVTSVAAFVVSLGL
jgi:hypothetical protein